MRIVDVRTVLLTGPSTNDPYLGRTRRSAAFIEILTDTELTGLGETYAGYFIPEAIPVDRRLLPADPPRPDRRRRARPRRPALPHRSLLGSDRVSAWRS